MYNNGGSFKNKTRHRRHLAGYRDQGLVDKLVAAAKKYAKKNGAKFLEAYPVKPDSPSYRFMGFINTFEKAGFHFVKEAGSRRHVMTKKI